MGKNNFAARQILFQSMGQDMMQESKAQWKLRWEVFREKPRFADFGVCAGVWGGNSVPSAR
jgi:hypothetical protein